MSQTYESAWNVFAKSRDIVTKNWQLFGLLYSAPLLVALISAYDRLHHTAVTGNKWSVFITANPVSGVPSDYSGGALFTTLAVVLSFISSLAMIVAATRYAQGKTPNVGKVLSELMDKGVRLILVTIVAVALSLVGFLFFIIPGFYILIRLFLAPYILVSDDTKVIEAIKKSWRLTKGRMWPVFSLLILSFVFAMTNIIPVIGSIVAEVFALLFIVAPAIRYFELKHKTK